MATEARAIVRRVDSGDSTAASVSRRPAIVAAAVIAAVVLAAILVSGLTGSLGIPHNDAWSYGKTALAFAGTGQMHLQGWGQMFLLGQIVTTVPFLLVFGSHESTLQIYGAAAATLTLACTYLLARRCTTRWRAVALVVIVSLFSGFGLLTASYMTDLPSAGAALLCLVLGARAVRHRDLAWLSAAFVAGLWALTIREQMLAAPMAVGFCAVIALGVTRMFRVIAAALTAATVGICAAGEHFRHMMPWADAPPWRLSELHLWLPPTLLPSYLTISLVVLPLSLWAVLGLRGRDFVHAGRVTGWLLGALAVGYVAYKQPGSRLTLPNYLDPSGAYPDAAVGWAPVIFGPAKWRLVQDLAAVGGVLLGGELAAALSHPLRLARRARRWDPALFLVMLFALIVAGVTVLTSLMGETQYDRYFVVVVPCVGIALLHRARSVSGAARVPAAAVASIAGLMLGVVSWNVTWSSDARDGAIWTAAQSLVRSGVNPRDINAGLAWNSTHSPGPAEKNLAVKQDRLYHGQRWARLFPGQTDCWIVSLSWIPGSTARLVSERPVHPYGLSLTTIPVYIFHRPATCPAPHVVPGSPTRPTTS